MVEQNYITKSPPKQKSRFEHFLPESGVGPCVRIKKTTRTAAITVSIVDNDLQACRRLEYLFRQAPDFNCVGMHGSGEAGLRTVPEAGPAIVLFEMNLPDMNGIEMVRRLKPSMPHTQFVMFTDQEDAKHVFDALAAGATGYLLKRASGAELLSVLKGIHATGDSLGGHIAAQVLRVFHELGVRHLIFQGLLSPRQREILALLERGYRYGEIAVSLRISLHTVLTQIRRMFKKLNVQSRAQAVATASAIFNQL